MDAEVHESSAEDAMPTTEALPLIHSGLVEISGWDEHETFFVERSELGWSDSAGEHITLSRMLSTGAIIFVRPIQPTAKHRANPIPYEAEFVGCSPEGFPRFRLNGVTPRYGGHDLTVN
jgi:hypothetical protein